MSATTGAPLRFQFAAGAPMVALVGNPNCGKTALFNLLTGSPPEGRQLRRRHGRAQGRPARHCRAASALRLLDLPGAYSLNPPTPDERVTLRRAGTAAPPARRGPTSCVCVVDATNLRLNLRLVLARQARSACRWWWR